MSKVSRGGHTFKTGKIGRVICLRQQLMMPGEKMNVRLKGQVRLESLRERDSMRINAHLGAFMTPLRWVWSDFPQYLKEGPDTVVTPPTNASVGSWEKLGIGSYISPGAGTYYKFFEDAYLRCVNEWYKWPESADWVFGDMGDHGVPAVPLAKTWTRCRFDATPDASADYTVLAATDFDVRDLAEVQAKFRSAMKRDVLSFNRWMELIQETYKGDGSREVDQVPIMLDQVEVGVNPREMPASDGASLGQWQSLFDFGVDHSIKGIVAPEHCIVTYLLTVRFASTMEGIHPLAGAYLDWHELTADPEYLASAKPVPVQLKELFQTTATTAMGYLPAGWQWRADHDVIGKAIDIRDSFPYMLQPTTQAEAKDATRVKDAFRSQALDDYVIDIYFTENSTQPIGDSMDSYMSGMVDDAQVSPGGRNQEFPKGGKVV